jgi:hypothetical protein
MSFEGGVGGVGMRWQGRDHYGWRLLGQGLRVRRCSSLLRRQLRCSGQGTGLQGKRNNINVNLSLRTSGSRLRTSGNQTGGIEDRSWQRGRTFDLREFRSRTGLRGFGSFAPQSQNIDWLGDWLGDNRVCISEREIVVICRLHSGLGDSGHF